MAPLCDEKKFLVCALSQKGKPYLWNHKGPSAYDCSGLVTWSLLKAGGPDWRSTHSCRVLARVLEPALVCTEGQVTLALYGKDWATAEHVMICLADGQVFGACGGKRTTLTLEIARKRDAKVRYRPSATYRPDLLGYRLLEAKKEISHG